MAADAEILGIHFARVGLREAESVLAERLARGERSFVITANPEFVMLARRDPSLAAIARDADLVVPDGTGIVLAARLLGTPLPGRAPGRLLVDGLVARAAADGRSLYLLGAWPGIAERAAAALRARHPALRIVGAEAGAPDAASDDAVTARVAAAAPDVLLVAYGMPLQERWIARNLARLPSVKIAIGVGGTLDYLAGAVPLPPPLVHRLGFEWLWRLVREPWRWRRQRALVAFAAHVLAARLVRRGTGIAR